MTDFLASLAHDMRSPLGVVGQAIGEVRSDFEAALSADQRMLLNLADRGLARLGRIASTVSLAATLDSGQFELLRGSLDLVVALRAGADAAIAVEPRREVQVTFALPEGPHPFEGDRERLQLAFSEVVHNAIRHARRRVHVTFERGESEARAVIEDDGQGIPDERRATLFRRFMPRVTRSGLNLGLSIAHDIVVAHGGRIALEPSTLPPGRAGTVGARFVITLPLPGGARPDSR